MNAGELNRVISIVKTTSTARSDDGAPILTISTRSSNVWAGKRPITGNERFIDNANFYEADVLWKIRYTTVVNELCQIKESTNYYNIKRIIDPYDRHVELHILGKMVR